MFHAYFTSQETQKANLLRYYPKLNLSSNAKIEIVNFCGKWQLFSYTFDQPTVS
jgi:hypothetical protein